MRQQLDRYRSNELPLHGLIGDLEFLLAHVEDAPKDWNSELLSQIGRLEDVYAVALDKKAGALDEADQPIVAESLKRIGELVESQLIRRKETDPG